MAEWLLTQSSSGVSVRIKADRIVEIGPQPPASGAEILSCDGCTIEPGAVNAHTHLYSGLAPLGLPVPAIPPENFVQILERIWWRLDRALDEDSLRAAARFYVAQALLAGTTALVDHHESPRLITGSLDILADACAELGCRALLTYGATERNGGIAEARAGLAECHRFVKANRRPTVHGLVGLHASFTVSDETIRTAGELCRALSVPMHVHVAEDLADVRDAEARGYRDPLDRLLTLGALPPGSIVAHGVHLDEQAVKRCESEGLWLVQNPRSNHGNRVGYPQNLWHSHRVALGTDGYPAQLAEEAAALWTYARAAGDHEASVAQRPVAGYALLAEHFALPFAPLAAGSAADLVVRSPSGQVEHVFVAGRLVVRHGGLVHADLAPISFEANQQAARLWQLMSTL